MNVNRKNPFCVFSGVICALLAAMFPLSTVAAGATWDQLLQEYIAGKDIAHTAATIETTTKYRSVQTKSASAQLADEIEVFLKAFYQIVPGQNASNLDLLAIAKTEKSQLMAIRPQFNQLNAQHLLYISHIENIQAELETNGSSQFQQQLQISKSRYLQAMEPFTKALSSIYEKLDNNEDVSGLESLWDQTVLSYQLYTLHTLANELVTDKELHILRAFTALPYEIAGSYSLPVDTQTKITPSYLQEQSPAASAADVQEAALVHFSDPILLKAKELNHDPIAIFNFVRNSIRTEWYAGAMKGGEGTLLQGSGNDIDQAALLIALYRASGLPSRFVHGVVEIGADTLKSQLGLANPTDVLPALRRLGIPAEAKLLGNTIDTVRVPYTWVSVQVPYSNYRGAVVDGSGKLWLGLMPAVKIVAVSDFKPVLGEMSFNATQFQAGYFTEVRNAQPIDTIRAQVQTYLTANGRGIYEDLLQLAPISNDSLGYLPSSLPLSVVQASWEQASVPSTLIHRLRLKTYSGTREQSAANLTLELNVADIASQRLTLSYIPGSVEEQQLVNSFGGLGNTPAYLVSLRPQIKLNGKLLAVAENAIAAGTDHDLEISLIAPFSEKVLHKRMTAGGYHAIGVSAQHTTSVNMEETAADTEYRAARILSQIALRYNQEWDQTERELGILAGRQVFRAMPAVTVASNEQSVTTLLGQPQELIWKGVSLDAITRSVYTLPSKQESLSAVDYMRLSGLQGSYLEHVIFKDLFKVDAISADKGLALARTNGIAVVDLTATNFAAQRSTLFHSAAVLNELEQLVGNGYVVTVPVSEQTIDAWTGSVWIAQEPATGAAGYFIAGALAGGSTTTSPDKWPADPANTLANPYGNEPNNDPFATRRLIVQNESNFQAKTVGTDAEPLEVMAVDEYNRAVVGATVHFEMVSGGGSFAGLQSLAVTTDSKGIAKAVFTMPTSTSGNQTYLKLYEDDVYSSQVGLSYVDVSAAIDAKGNTRPSEAPFTMVATPGNVTSALPLQQAYSGRLGESSGVIRVNLTDSYGNPVANAEVNASIGLLYDKEGVSYSKPARIYVEETGCRPLLDFRPLWTDGCGTPTATAVSDAKGSVFFKPILAPDDLAIEEAKQIVNWQHTTADGATLSGTAEYYVVPESNEYFAFYKNSHFQNAAKVGGKYTGNIGVYVVNPNQSAKYTWGTIGIGESFFGPVSWTLQSIFDSNYSSSVDNDSLMVRLGGSLTGIPALGQPGADNVTVNDEESTHVGPAIYAVETSLVEENDPLVLDLKGDTAANGVVKFAMRSKKESYQVPGTFEFFPAYNPLFAELLILEDDKPLYRFPVNDRVQRQDGAFEYSVIVPKGIKFDDEKSYYYQAAFDRGSDVGQVLSEPAPVKFKMPLFAYLMGSKNVPRGHSGTDPVLQEYRVGVSAFFEVDKTNDFVCYSEAFIKFGLTRDSRVVTEVKKPDGNWSIIGNTTLNKGAYKQDISFSGLMSGANPYRITATDNETGIQQTIEGEIALRLVSREAHGVE